MNDLRFKSAMADIQELISDIDGWTPEDQLYAIYLIILLTKDLEGDILEIGSWCGRSSVVMAKAAKLIGSKLHCVDLFPSLEDWFENEDGTHSFCITLGGKKYHGFHVQTMWKEPYENAILPMYQKQGKGTLEIFKENISRKGFNGIAKAYRGDSTDFSNNFKGKIKVAFIDGDHSYDATRIDLQNIEKHLISGGYVVFDDAFSVFTGVDKAITQFVVNSDNYDFYQQISRKCFIARKK